MPHPYKFHIGASWAGKPPDARAPRKQQDIDFPIGSDIAIWKKSVLSWPKNFPSTEAGEDFLYVQEVWNSV